MLKLADSVSQLLSNLSTETLLEPFLVFTGLKIYRMENFMAGEFSVKVIR